MGEITICEKPEWIHFEDISALLVKAHKANPNVSFPTTNLSSEEWNRRLETGGTVIVALDGRKLAGTITLSVEACNKWYARCEVARCRYVAVSPDYTRRHIASDMIDACANWARSRDIPVLFWTTAANNAPAINLCHRNGFVTVDYHWYSNIDHPSVALMRWLNGKQPSKLLLQANYCKSRFCVQLKHSMKSIMPRN